MGGTVDNTKLSGRAVIYARSASAHPTDHGDIEGQLARCRQLVDGLKLQLMQEFVDCGESGLRRDRPGLLCLLTYLEANPIDCVICSDIVRLSRSDQHLRYLLTRLEMLDVQLVTLDGTSDQYRALVGRQGRVRP